MWSYLVCYKIHLLIWSTVFLTGGTCWGVLLRMGRDSWYTFRHNKMRVFCLLVVVSNKGSSAPSIDPRIRMGQVKRWKDKKSLPPNVRGRFLLTVFYSRSWFLAILFDWCRKLFTRWTYRIGYYLIGSEKIYLAVLNWICLHLSAFCNIICLT